MDRILSLGPGRLLAGITSATEAVPVLMYHRISSEPEADAPYYRLNTSPTRFEEHLRALNELGFRSVNLDDALEACGQGKSESKSVVITFDDGFRDFYECAYPILKKYGHTATMFLPTSFIGEQRSRFKGTECLTWREVRELRANGMEFGSHTVSHPKLYELSWKGIEAELAASKDQIEQETSEKITSFAYPYAFPQEDHAFVGSLTEILRGRNYQTCVTTMVGRMRAGADPFCLRRLPVNDCDDRRLFVAKLRGAYDWFGCPQHWSRRMRRWMRGGRRAIPAGRLAPRDLSAAETAQKSTL